MNTKQTIKLIAICHLLSALCLSASAQGTAFTYQGRLQNNGNPASGTYNLTFSLFNVSGGGSAAAGPVTTNGVLVTNGLFTVTLDFGSGVFNGTAYWLEMGMETNGAGSFTTLVPRQPLTSSPYAIFAGHAATSAGYSGPVALSQLPPTVALLNSNQVFTGVASFSNPSNSFAGNGAGLDNVRFSTLDGTGVESLRFGNLVFKNFLNATSGPVATGDMNGDGRIDFIGYDNSTGSILVMTNNGASSFGLLASYGPGVSTGGILVADVNGDGKLDVVTTATGNSVSVFTNAGAGTLVLASTTATGTGPSAIATADFNNDGRPDVVTVDAVAATLTVLTNNGNAGFGFFATLTGVGPLAEDVITADVNGDHWPDIISSKLSQSLISGNLTVFTNNGGNGFVLASTPTTGVNPIGIAAADLNGDSQIDLVSADYGAFGFGNTISVLINAGGGNFSLASTPSVGTATGPALITTGDVNNDGKIDVFCTTAGTNSTGTYSVSVLTNDGTGFLNLSTVLPGEESVVPADINNDGYTDLIGSISRTNGNSIISIPDVWLNESSGISFHIPVIAENGLTVNGVATLNNAGNSFSGNGNGLVNLNAANLIGSVPAASLTSVPASSLTGAIADARLSANVALLNASQAFSGLNQFNNGLNVRGPMNITNISSGSGIVLQGAGNSTAYYIDATNGERAAFALAAFAGHFSADAAPGDMVMRALSSKLLLQSGGSAAALVVATNNNVGIGTNNPTQKLVVVGNIVASGTVTQGSDRNSKEHFTPINPQEILHKVSTLPISRWNYKTETDITHLGPMAQDFHSAFDLNGSDDKHIAIVDEGGVALAAIQGLDRKLEQKETEITELKRQNDALEKRLDNLAKVVKSLGDKN